MLRSWDNMPKGVPLLPSPTSSSCLCSYTPEAKGEKNFWKLSFSEKASALQHMEDVKRTRVLYVQGRCLDSLPSANSHPHKQLKPPRMVCCHLSWLLSPLFQELLLTTNCCYSPCSQTFSTDICIFCYFWSRLKRKSGPPHYSGHIMFHVVSLDEWWPSLSPSLYEPASTHFGSLALVRVQKCFLLCYYFHICLWAYSNCFCTIKSFQWGTVWSAWGK